jgi:hypothetical protein
MIDATATALVQDEAMPAPEVQVESAPEVDLASEMEAIWERSQSDETPKEPEPEPEPEAEATVEGEAEPDAEEAPEELEIQAPSELPLAIKKNWAAIPQEARDAFLEAQRESNRKLGEQGRLMQGIAPIRDVLTGAVKDLPSLANMKPQDVAREVMQLARASNDFNTKPVETMMGLIKQHGLEQAIAQHLSGQGVSDGAQSAVALQQEVAQLKRQISQLTDPEFLSGQFSTFSTQQRAATTVEQFAASKPEWAEVEPYLPAAINFVRQSSANQLSEQDLLDRAYTLALGQIKPDAIKAQTAEAAPKAAPAVDPERSRKALQAKSVNLPDRGGAKPKPLTEKQIMDSVWEKHQS